MLSRFRDVVISLRTKESASIFFSWRIGER
jgi:hypothetical protein